MKELQDPKFRELKSRFESRLVDFVRLHAEEILRQADADAESEVPIVPLFDDYLRGLEAEIRRTVAEAGYFNGTATRLVDHYRNTFYYNTLANLAYNSTSDGKLKPDAYHKTARAPTR